jgi:hypothetical protein
MSDLTRQARPAVESLAGQDEDQLYKELGLRLQAIQRDPSISASFEPQIPTQLEAMGAAEDLRAFGQRFFQRVNVQAYQLVCGQEDEDSEDRESVINAFGLGRDAVAAAIAGLLVAQLGLAPAIAAVVAALIIRVFFRSAYEAMCEVWSEKQPQGGPGG